MADSTSPRSGAASSAKDAYLQKVAKANEPKGKKERVWTPKADDQYRVQTTSTVGGGPPPKKSFADLP